MFKIETLNLCFISMICLWAGSDLLVSVEAQNSCYKVTKFTSKERECSSTTNAEDCVKYSSWGVHEDLSSCCKSFADGCTTYLEDYIKNADLKISSWSTTYTGSVTRLLAMVGAGVDINKLYYKTLEDCAEACSTLSGCLSFVDNRDRDPVYCVLKVKNDNTVEDQAKDLYILDSGS